MQKNRWLMCSLIVSGVLLYSVGTARADDPPKPDPEQIARQCIEQMTRLADSCVTMNRLKAHRTVQVIEELLAQGEQQKARKVAMQALASINEHSQRCVVMIRQHCHRCIELIVKAGGGQALVERVKTACEAQVAKVQHSRKAALEAIHNTLTGGGGGQE